MRSRELILSEDGRNLGIHSELGDLGNLFFKVIYVFDA
jgi:hypothetical protein